MTYDEVRKMALPGPASRKGLSYGTPSLKVKGKFLTRLREDGDSLVIKDVDFDERDMLMEAAPEVFYITDHYKGWPMVLVRLSKAHPQQWESHCCSGPGRPRPRKPSEGLARNEGRA